MSELAKGYLVVEFEVTDSMQYERYRALASHLPAQYGGKVIIGHGKPLPLEGDWAPKSFFVVEFPSYERAKAFYFCAEYQAALPMRLAASNSKGFLIEGSL